MRHPTNHKGTRELDFTEILMWLVILGELLESHGKITSSAAIKHNDIVSPCYKGKFEKMTEYTHTVYCVYTHQTQTLKR